MFDRAAKFFAKEIIVLMKIQLPDRILNLMRAWFWTMEIVSLALVALCWSSTIVPAAFPWNPQSVFSFLFDFSSSVIALLLVTTCLLWWKHRKLAIGGLALWVAWIIWAALPRFTGNISGL